jgi:hypothetical protein
VRVHRHPGRVRVLSVQHRSAVLQQLSCRKRKSYKFFLKIFYHIIALNTPKTVIVTRAHALIPAHPRTCTRVKILFLRGSRGVPQRYGNTKNCWTFRLSFSLTFSED